MNNPSTYKTVVHTSNLSTDARCIIGQSIAGEIDQHDKFAIINHDQASSWKILSGLREQLSLDLNTLPVNYQANSVKLVISDMDSTLIAIECIDEIADYMGVKAQVSAITESAMNGDIDFETSLKKRVALLETLPEEVLGKVYEERLALNPGAERLIQELHNKQIKTALVSGGFTYFTEKLKERLSLGYTLANKLEIIDKKLTGKVSGSIVTANRKAQFLQQICDKLTIDASQAIAIGDGANDLEMMKVAGLGVAYKAKPVVQQQADVVINYNGLDAVLDFVA